VLRAGLRLLLILSIGAEALAVTAALATSVPACPVGQVPNWNNTGCMAVQTNPSYASYGIPSQEKAYLPGGTVNSNPAIQNCNGIPIPLGEPCSAAKPSLATMPLSSVASTIASQTPSSTGSEAPPSGVISVSAGQPASSAGAAASAAVSPSSPPLSESPATAAAVAAFSDPTQALTNLLGDWYSGWLQYAAGALNLSPAAQESVSTTFLAFPACLQGQQQACEDAIWASLSQWLGPSLSSTAGGS
jgi:hypothetical protein